MRRSYLMGIIGGLIGGLIATIPWILLYVYEGMMCSFFAFFIGIGALKGYQYKGITDGNLSKIVTIISLICISIATLIIIPSIIIYQGTTSISVTNLILLYSIQPFASMILKNYLIAVIFTFLGLRGVMYRINGYY